MHICVIGGVSYDTLIHLGNLPKPKSQTIFAKKIIRGIGSTGAGKAIPLAKLGFDVTFHAMIGNDQEGQIIQEILAKENIHFIYDIDPKGTEQHTNLMSDDGKRISIYTHPQTFEPEVNEQAIKQAILDADIVVMNIINYTRRFIELAKDNDKPLWIDIHDYDGNSDYHKDYIEAADFLFLSKDLMDHPASFANMMLKKGKQAVIVTDGPKGATCYQSNEVIHLSSIQPEITKDFNGAGDHVLSGYLYAYVNKYKAKECLYAGMLCATACIESDMISNDMISEHWLKKKLKVSQ